MERVVITGIGALTPIGTGKDVFWNNLLEGKLGFSQVSSFDTSRFRVSVGAEIKAFSLEDYLPGVDADRFGRATQFALAASRLAMDDAGIDLDSIEPDSAGASMGTTSGEPNQIEEFNDHFVAQELGRVGPEFVGRYPCHNIPAAMAAEFNLTGVAPVIIPAACAAGNYAISHAASMIGSGRVEMMLAGGSDAFSRITYTGFARLGAIAPEVCTPFDKNRKGMIPGEGSGVLVLESLSRALDRGARIYAEVLSYGFSCDAFHMTGGHPEGRGAVRAMEKALEVARITPKQVDYISAHGTGTKSNDLNETTAVKNVFNGEAYNTPISSIKSMLGHTMGAASALEAAVCAMAITHNVAPPTMNLQETDETCDLDYIPNQPREMPINIAMNNAYAFGGNNSSLILKRAEV